MHPQLSTVGIVDLLEADPRPTFIIDSIEASTTTVAAAPQIAYYNPALAACDPLVDLLHDPSPNYRTQHAALWEWLTASPRPSSSTGAFYYLGAQWSKCLVQQRWLVVGANEQPLLADRPNKVRLDSQKGSFGVSGSANKVASSPRRGPVKLGTDPGANADADADADANANADWILPNATRTDHEPYLAVIAGRDWTCTPLGAPSTWPTLLRQTVQQILVDSRPIAISWGDAQTLLYNEAFSRLCGSRHPSALGKSVEDVWPGSAVEEMRAAMAEAAQHRKAILECEWQSLAAAEEEEVYIKCSAVPIVEGVDRVRGFLHPVLDTTSLRLWERRMKMLVDLGDALLSSRGVATYWAKLLETLGAVTPQYDIPLAILYSVYDDSAKKQTKLCRFEGGLGVPEGHAIAPATLSISSSSSSSSAGLAPVFQEALYAQRDAPFHIQTSGLPDALMQGLEWRGFGDACQNIIVCPIRPTRDENVMGLLVLGLNPRRPYDNDYQQFISLLNQKLASTLASTVLLEEESRRGRNAAQQAAYEQAQLEAKLADRTREATESLKKFEAVADFIPVGMAFQNAQGVLTYCNDAWHRITGTPPQETGPSIALRDILSYIVEEDRPNVVRAYERLETEDNVTFECRLIRRNVANSPPPPTRESPSFEKAGVELQGIDNHAPERHILAAARVVERSLDGRVRQVLTCLTDVTLHKQTADEAIRRAQQAENLKRMAELATVGMYEVDRDGKLIEANNVFFQMCGLEKDAYDMERDIVKPWETCVCEDDLPVLQHAMHQVVDEGTPQTCEVRFKLPWKAVDSHGTEIVAPRWAQGTFLPVRSSDGSVQSFCGCVSDVSLQKWQLERERLRKEEALESKRQQENFIDMTSHEMRNPLSAIIHCADAVIASLSKALELPSSSTSSSSTNRNKSKNMNMNKSKALLTSTSTSTSGPAEDQMLMESSIENAETIIACAQHQKRIVDDILTMSKLDSKLLAVTPITVDPLQIAQEALKMFEVEARRVDIDLQMKVDPSYERLRLEYLDLDPSRLKQVLINLLTNALKFTKHGVMRNVTITVSASKTKPTDSSCSVQFIPPLQGDEFQQPMKPCSTEPIFVIFEVKDTGQGLTEDEMKSLFQRFKQASARTHVKYGGSGLGLFISRRLCEMHNGAIGVASLPGVGSTFAFYVEAHRPSAEALKEARATARTALQANALPITKRAESLQIGSVEVPLKTTPLKNSDSTVASPGTLEEEEERKKQIALDEEDDDEDEPTPEPPKIEGILVVEDNMINQQLTRRGLIDRGFTVDVANHGLEALEKLQTSDRWLGDVPMPDVTSPLVETPTRVDLVTPTATPIKFPLSLILMDVEMPIQDGLTCTRHIRELERQGKILGGHIPIIAVSANARLEQILEAKAAGCDDVMIKPYRFPELIDKMRVVAMQVEKKNRAAASASASAAAASAAVSAAANSAQVPPYAATEAPESA